MFVFDAATLRWLAARFQVDPRTIRREARKAGSVKGMAGARARAALAFYAGERTSPQPSLNPPPRAA